MKNLEELVQIVTSSNKKNNDFSSSFQSNSKMFQLFRTLAEGDELAHADIFHRLYEKNDSRPYRVLKYRLREKLLNDALRLDATKLLRNQYDVAQQKCMRNLLLAQLLLLKYKRHAAVDLLRQTVLQSKKLQLIIFFKQRFHTMVSGMITHHP